MMRWLTSVIDARSLFIGNNVSGKRQSKRQSAELLYNVQRTGGRNTRTVRPPEPHASQGDEKNDIMSVFRGNPGVGAVLLRHSSRNMPSFTDPKTDPRCKLRLGEILGPSL